MIGIDTVRITRIKRAVESDAFVSRVFTPAEREYCDGKANGAQSYAGIFCAKEAAAKAVGRGFGNGFMPCDIEVLHDVNGAPRLKFYGGAAQTFAAFTASVSISHDGDYAVAVVELTERS